MSVTGISSCASYTSSTQHGHNAAGLHHWTLARNSHPFCAANKQLNAERLAAERTLGLYLLLPLTPYCRRCDNESPTQGWPFFTCRMSFSIWMEGAM